MEWFPRYTSGFSDPVSAAVHGLFRYDPDGDFSVTADEENGTAVLWENTAGSFRRVYEGIQCSLYEVSDDHLLPGLTAYRSELICTDIPSVIREERIEDVFRFFQEEAEKGHLKLHWYSEQQEYRNQLSLAQRRVEAWEDAHIFVIENGILLKFIPGKFTPSVTVPKGVTVIGHEAFAETRIDSIMLPEGVTVIEEYAFFECTLFDISLPQTLTRIGSWAFGTCEWMRQITIPDSVTEIDPWAIGYHTGPDTLADNMDPAPNAYITTIYGKKGSEAERYARENETFRGKKILRFKEMG